VQLLRRVTIAVTDSTAVQEAAISLSVPTLIASATTDRPEGVHAGNARLVGTDPAVVGEALNDLVSDPAIYRGMSTLASPFGSGDTAKRVARIVELHGDLLRESPASQQDFVDPALLGGLMDNTAASEIAHGKGRRKIPGAITVVMTVFKRSPKLFRMQLESLLAQTLTPTDIFVWQNEAHVDVTTVLADFPEVKHVWARTWNSRFHGRFLLPLMIDTEFVAVADDDTIPGVGWLEYAVSQVREHNALIGSSGRDINLPEAQRLDVAYWSAQSVTPGPANKPKLADFTGHWWVMRSAWAHHIWAAPHPTYHTSEDTSISATLQIYGGIDTVVVGTDVPDRINPEARDEITVGNGANALRSSKDPIHGDVRRSVFRYWLSRGWAPKQARGAA